MMSTKTSSEIRITGISLPVRIVDIIDSQRGDINRSKYILRLLEKILPSEASSFNPKVVT